MSAEPVDGEMGASVRVVLVDDQELVRTGLRLICDSEPGIEVVGEASTGEEALTVVAATRPDVVLMDVQMPVLDGLAATRRLTATGSAAHVVMLTTFERDDYLFDSLRAGASGFLLKNSPPEDLVAAIKVVASGAALLDPAVTRRVIEAAVHARPTTVDTPGLEHLTPREREVLAALGRGLSNAEIAGALYIGEATVKTHVSNVLTKLALRDRVQAVVYAHEHGLLGD